MMIKEKWYQEFVMILLSGLRFEIRSLKLPLAPNFSLNLLKNKETTKTFHFLPVTIHHNDNYDLINKTNDLILNLTPENVTRHSRIE